MAINQRLKQTMQKPEYREGYPDLLFEGFRWRFGEITAVMTNAKMQAISGLADPAIAKHPKAECGTIMFFTQAQMFREVERRIALGLNYRELQELADTWPTHSIPSSRQHRLEFE